MTEINVLSFHSLTETPNKKSWYQTNHGQRKIQGHGASGGHHGNRRFLLLLLIIVLMG